MAAKIRASGKNPPLLQRIDEARRIATINDTRELRKTQIAELYRTILKREPDEAGINYWLNDSMSISQIRENFTQLRANELAQSNSSSTVV